MEQVSFYCVYFSGSSSLPIGKLKFRSATAVRCSTSSDLLDGQQYGTIPTSLLACIPERWSRAVRPPVESMLSRTAALCRTSIDLIYANTAATAPQVRALRQISSTLLWHIHELSHGLRLSLPHGPDQVLLRTATRVVAVSDAVRTILTDEYRVPSDRVDLIDDFAPSLPPDAVGRELRRRRLLARLGWPPNAFVVGGCGALGWRRGTDLFVQIARTSCASVGSDNVRFLWLGGDERSLAAGRI